LASDGEKRGCGAPGRRIRIAAATGDAVYFSDESVPWPSSGSAALDVNFTAEDAGRAADNVTPVFGNVYGADGKRMPPGTVIEAYVGDVLCGMTAIPPTPMLFDSPDVFDILVAGPEAVPGCDRGAVVSFRVNGGAVEQTATNGLDGDVALDLTLR
jgi:hypothetical protein